jgi:hypothetical protein
MSKPRLVACKKCIQAGKINPYHDANTMKYDGWGYTCAFHQQMLKKIRPRAKPKKFDGNMDHEPKDD